MRKKLRLIMLVLRIRLYLNLIRSGRNKAENYFRNGGSFPNKKSLKMYGRLKNHCDRATLLIYKYKKLTSVGATPMEHAVAEAVTR